MNGYCCLRLIEGRRWLRNALIALGVISLSMSVAAADSSTPRSSESSHFRTRSQSFRVQRSLPEPYARVVIDGKVNFLADGQFYTEIHRGGQAYYAPVQPAYGSLMQGMPTQWRVLQINGRTYYRNGPHFFVRQNCDGEAIFKLNKPPLGAKVDMAPRGGRVFRSGDTVYYSADGIYYEQINNDGSVEFEVVQRPS